MRQEYSLGETLEFDWGEVKVKEQVRELRMLDRVIDTIVIQLLYLLKYLIRHRKKWIREQD